ncbi:glycosyltransferase [Halobacteria archaeon AArc-curdl1]|uniref:Glycosyltransferase n=1 Tax=Natronosalvus hydrolyticus TaxID=2979988 RepID=A0AAP2ZC33_9EURY|nr:glycosyltransferase [Halobacteria archaeon AArc-curdl1]
MDVLTLTNAPDAPFLQQQLEALEERGVSVTVRAVGGDPTAARSRGPIPYFRFFRTVRAEPLAEYDLIHAHYGLTAPMALAQRELPVVLSLWGSDVHGPVKPVSRLCAPRCDEVLVMSQAMADALSTPCRVIPDGVDLGIFKPQPQEKALETVGWSENVANVLFPYAPDRSVKNYPRARRVVDAVGKRLERPVELRTVSGVDHEAMVAYMNAADALLLTSHSEGSPNSVKEAMACNLAVVAADVGDVRERLEGVEPSTVATNDEELIDGLTDTLEHGVRSNGRDMVGEVSLQATTDSLLEVYDSVIGDGTDDESDERTAQHREKPPRA